MKKVLYIFISVFKWLFRLFPRETHLYNSRFATPAELKNQMTGTFDGASLLIGTTHTGKILRVKQSPTRRELGNMLVVGRTRSGKGLHGIAQVLTWPHSLIVNDIKGEIHRMTAGYRSTFSDIIVFDPDGVGDPYAPMQELYSERDLLSAATHLLYKPNEGSGAIFTKRAINLTVS
jgi:type IV secretion system protein VirD4